MTKESGGCLAKSLGSGVAGSQEDLADLGALSVRTIQRVERAHTASAEPIKALAAFRGRLPVPEEST